MRDGVSLAGRVRTIGAVAVILGAVVSCSSTSTSTSDTSATAASAASVSFSDWRKSIAEEYGISDPPAVTPIRTNVSPSDTPGLITACLASKGFTPEDGVPVSQVSALKTAEYVCTVSYQPGLAEIQPLTTAQKNIYYTYMTTSEIPCLENLGYTIQGVPSRDVYVATFDTKLFTPFAQVHDELKSSDQTNEYWDDLGNKCPQDPPASELYGPAH